MFSHLYSEQLNPHSPFEKDKALRSWYIRALLSSSNAGIDGIGDAEFIFQQAEQVSLLLVPVDVVFLIGLEGFGC